MTLNHKSIEGKSDNSPTPSPSSTWKNNCTNKCNCYGKYWGQGGPPPIWNNFDSIIHPDQEIHPILLSQHKRSGKQNKYSQRWVHCYSILMVWNLSDWYLVQKFSLYEELSLLCCLNFKHHSHFSKEVIGENINPPFLSSKQIFFKIHRVPIRSFFFSTSAYFLILFIFWTTTGWTIDKITCNIAYLHFTNNWPSSISTLNLSDRILKGLEGLTTGL